MILFFWVSLFSVSKTKPLKLEKIFHRFFNVEFLIIVILETNSICDKIFSNSFHEKANFGQKKLQLNQSVFQKQEKTK